MIGQILKLPRLVLLRYNKLRDWKNDPIYGILFVHLLLKCMEYKFSIKWRISWKWICSIMNRSSTSLKWANSITSMLGILMCFKGCVWWNLCNMDYHWNSKMRMSIFHLVYFLYTLIDCTYHWLIVHIVDWPMAEWRWRHSPLNFN